MSGAKSDLPSSLAQRLRGLRREAGVIAPTAAGGAITHESSQRPAPAAANTAVRPTVDDDLAPGTGRPAATPNQRQRMATAVAPARPAAATSSQPILPVRMASPALPDAWQVLLGRGPASSAAANAGAPRDAATALRRLLQVRGRRAMPGPARPDPPDRQLPGECVAPGLHYLQLLADWPARPSAIDTRFARLDQTIAADRLLLFDTETTGLAGGTGTRAFMIGAADWHQGRFRLRQLTISSLAGEDAMLAEFARWLSPDTVLVSYNGKSYDAPLLATRYRLARRDNPLAGKLHLDLLHPVRRHWRSEWENCRLGTAERQLLDVVREDDLPGAEAPAAWLGYLRGGSAHNLRRVAAHNQQDLRSLAGILFKLSQLAATPEPAAQRHTGR